MPARPLVLVALACVAAACGLVFPLQDSPSPDAGADAGSPLFDGAPHGTDAGPPDGDAGPDVAADAGTDTETDAAGSGPIDSLEAYVKASNTQEVDRFGYRVALSVDGMVLAVSEPFEDSAAVGVGSEQGSNGAPDSGAVYLFRRVDGVWAQEAYVKASNTGAVDQFGKGLALSADGSVLAVGAEREDSAATGVGGDEASNGTVDSGAAYVFRRTGGEWAQEAYVKASNAEANDIFGSVLALSADGDVLAVGAVGEDSAAVAIGGDQVSNGAIDSGAVYVFRRSNGGWAQEAYVKAANGDAGDLLGAAVALSAGGDVLAVGAFGEDGAPADPASDGEVDSGAAYVFRRVAGVWSQEAYLKGSSTGSGDIFGLGLTLSGDGDVLAVGAYGEDGGSAGIGGDETSNAAQTSGAAYVFRRTAGIWGQEAYFKASNTEAGDSFGMSLALSSDARTLAVGATAEDSAATGVDGDQASNLAFDSGAVYVFRRPDDRWVQEAYLKAPNTDLLDMFGYALALPADGDVLAVGSAWEDGAAVGIGGNQASNLSSDSGAAYVYR